MKITVIGTGYVGLVSGVCFAEIGNEVTCVDIDAAKVAQLQRGKTPIYEPGLEELLQANIGRERLAFTTDLAAGIAEAQGIFLALPTPPGADGAADLSAVMAVAQQLGGLLPSHFVVVINKSTVPVGTAEKVRQTIAAKHPDNFAVVSNPEFLREGLAVRDFMEPDRVVIGTASPQAESIMRELYTPLTDDTHPLFVMDERSAELSKYAANAFLATKISFINEIANVAERVGANVEEVARAMGADERIGARFLQAGIGYGGSCFPKDVQALEKTARDHEYDFKIVQAVLSANQAQQERLIQKVREHYGGGSLTGLTFALWGLAFKPDTDDIREAPSLKIIDALSEAGAHIHAYDPEAMANVERHYKAKSVRLTLTPDAETALRGADALLIATEWKVFRNMDPQTIRDTLSEPVIFDGRNLFDPAAMSEAGITYKSIGRP